MPKKFVYVAGPYSHKNGAVMYARYQVHEEAAAQLIVRGESPFSPIVHWHHAAPAHSLPTEYRFWEHYNETMLSNAGLLWVIDLPGLNVSKGTAHEIMVANKLEIPIHIHDPNEYESYRYWAHMLDYQ